MKRLVRLVLTTVLLVSAAGAAAASGGVAGAVAPPTLTTTPNLTSVTLSGSAVGLTDTAMLGGALSPTGTITFRLVYDGATTVDTETATVNGNGSYTTPTGYILPTSGTVVGTYQWNATYSGDANNLASSDTNDPAEQVVVSAANPVITTTSVPSGAVVLGPTAPPPLTDTATLAGGANPTGTITFTLVYNGGITVDSETISVNGNGSYATPTGYVLPTAGSVTGPYQWNATYSGDTNNNPVSEINNFSEQVAVEPASPTLTTTASPSGLPSSLPALTDSAVLAGGYFPTGTMVFTLTGPGGFAYTQTDTVSGNGTYTASTTSPPDPVGTYSWTARYAGDGNNVLANDQGGPAEQTVVQPAVTSLATTPAPAGTVKLGTGSVTLRDTAVLSGGVAPTGTITFTLLYDGGPTIDTETVTVTGNGSYTTPTGFTLPTFGTTTGTFQWNASYSGDVNNTASSENSSPGEQVTVQGATPTLTTVASPAALPSPPPTLTDDAVLAGGYFSTGTMVFTLTGPGGFAYTQTDTVNGNGTYTAGTTLPPNPPGTYTWAVQYLGDSNNAPANDQGGPAEQTVVQPASPTLTTIPSPAGIVTLGTGPAPTLTDTAVLSGGVAPTGTITFTLVFDGGTTVDTEVVTVTGNGPYTTPTGYTLPTAGPAAGTYQWNATYAGDPDNNAASEHGSPNELVTVPPAIPTVTTTASPTVLPNPAPTLSDTAVLAGGYVPTGTIVFTLTGPGGFAYTQSDTVSGNGTYSASTTLPANAPGTYTWAVDYLGDSNNASASDQGGASEQTVVQPVGPALTTTPGPSGTVTLGTGPAPTLTDTAVLAGGVAPTGTITFTLFHDGGSTPVDTELVTVTGNGSYTTLAGYTLPTTGTAAGAYQWNATYSGDANNNAVSDTGSADEQVTVQPAAPALTTTPSPAGTVTLGTGSGPTLTDTATLTGGFAPTGTITFTLHLDGGSTPVDTETVTVTGNGSYTTPTGYTLPTTGPAAGTYQWNATYSGDTNNGAASDTGSAGERVTVQPAAPALTTTPSPAGTVTGTGSGPILTDTATLTGGFAPTGSITFTLFLDGGSTPVDTETVAVDGNGSYTTPAGMAAQVGTYQWNATYSGDTNNGAASDTGSAGERVTVTAPPPSLSGGSRLAVLPSGTGVWIVHSDGGVFSYGAPFYGSLPGLGIHVDDIVGIAATPDGKGYWLAGADGGVFAFGDARFLGSMSGRHLNSPVVAIVSTPDGKGYWLVGADGGVFAFGDAPFLGSMAGAPLASPVVGMTADPTGGYWLVGADGGVFAFGGAPFFGSMAHAPLFQPVVGIASAPGGVGYWLVAEDGGVFAFGGAVYKGSLGGSYLRSPDHAVIGLFTNGGTGYTVVIANGTAHPFS